MRKPRTEPGRAGKRREGARSCGRIWIRVLGGLIFCAGLALLSYPVVNRLADEHRSEAVLDVFERELSQAAGRERNGAGDGAGSGPELDRLYRDLLSYNETIYEEGQAGLRDPFDYENAGFDLTEYGFSQNVIAEVEIPRLEVRLPVYLGANEQTLADGAALLGQTSMPLDTVPSNAVIAAHRGWKGIPRFRYIDRLEEGDEIILHTPWDTLTYRVCEIRIISPEDIEEIYIRPGRNLVTLLTCHPYTKNYQRYMVIAERSEE